MASKKYKNKLCVYCTNEMSTEGDHVIAREFFLLQHRDNLPKVPACKKCNNEKSDLETYLTAVLPFSATHTHALENLSAMAPKRLEANQKLSKELTDSIKTEWLIHENGLYLPVSSIKFQGEKLTKLATFITKGLIWHHWKIYLNEIYDVRAVPLPDTKAEELVKQVKESICVNREAQNFYEGTFSYCGYQGDYPELSFWHLKFYNGLSLGAEEWKDESKIISLLAFSARKAVLDAFDEKYFRTS